MQQVVLAHVVRDDLQHRAVEIGINRIADPEPQGFVAVDGHAGGQELIGNPTYHTDCSSVRPKKADCTRTTRNVLKSAPD